MDEKRPPSESSDGESEEGSNGRRRIYRRSKSKCEGRLWIFMVLGAVILVLGIVIGGLYFNMKTLTESTEFTQVTPTYVNAIAVLCSALSVALLFWRRLTCLVFLCVITCTVTAFLCGITAILTGTHVIRPIMQLTDCSYLPFLMECRCKSPYKRSMLEISYTPEDPASVVFTDTDSCDSIQKVMLHMLYALIGVYVISFLFTVGAAILALLVLRMEKIRMGLFEDDTYEEIFTVSNSSATPPSSDSDNENQHMLHPILPSSDDGRIPESHIIRRSRSFSQPRFPTSADGPEKSIPKITVSAPTKSEPQGKLKEHRRRSRRAVTLHNLDTHQLMVILSLQMRYLQENENAQSQSTLSAQQLSQQLRRALTPQPNHDRQNRGQSQEVRQIRSHTPQPYHFKNRSSYIDPSQPNYENMFDPTEFINQLKQEQAQSGRNGNKVPAERDLSRHNTVPASRPKTPRQGYSSQTIPPPQNSRKGNKTPIRSNYYEEIDDMADCLDDSSASEQIYENHTGNRRSAQRRNRGQGEGHSVPVPAVCVQGNGGEPRDITNILPALYPSIPRHLFDRSQTPSRPKSYLNAVDASDSPQTSRRQPSHNPIQHNPSSQINSTQVMPVQENGWRNQDVDSESTDSAIYAMPVKKRQPAKPARNHSPDWPGSQPRPSLPGQSDVRSAFHVVPRSKKSKPAQKWSGTADPSARLQVSARTYDGNMNDFNMQGQSNHVSNVSAFFPPPYSPPPSYTDVITHSRDSSLHSLTSSTSTSEDVDFYQQIRKPQQPPRSKVSPHESQNVCSNHNWEENAVFHDSIPYNGPGINGVGQRWNGMEYQNIDETPNGRVAKTSHRRQGYDAFQDQPVRGPTSRSLAPGVQDVSGCEAPLYGATTASTEGNSSDSDCMETVI
ncbi:uncharacterized protein [Haliotis asinina]|uniref:uncharacterized protein n=1 Tax=Haliotis asinina TaxID=109174 RepID=UPI00353185D8